MTIDFADLPPATEDADQSPPAWVETSDPEPEPEPEGPICETCGKEIIREPGKRGRLPKYHPECRPSVKKASTSRKKTKKAPGVPSYKEGIDSIFQMVAFGLTMAGERNEMLLADGLAIAEHGPNISTALDQLAMEKPEIAAVLDRVLAVGPYGLLLSAVAPLILQVGSNHGVKIPNMLDAKSYVKKFVPAGVN